MPRHVTAEQPSLAQLLSNDASPPFREREKCNVSLCLWWTGKVQRLKLASENVLCHYICAIYISKSPSETLTPAVFLSDLSPPSHTHTDSRVHEKWWLVRLSLSLHPTTYSLSFSLSASFSCSVYLSSTMQFPQKMVKWSYKNYILYKIKLNDNIP